MFTQHCFIRKNTPELREKLKDLGYKVHKLTETEYRKYGIFCNRKVAIGVPSPEDFDMQRYLNEYRHIIDCKDNEELFLAIAALRDDSDRNQWFIHNNKVFGDSGWEFCKKDKFQMLFYAGEIGDTEYFTDATDKFHKATVEELIKHFKNK